MLQMSPESEGFQQREPTTETDKGQLILLKGVIRGCPWLSVLEQGPQAAREAQKEQRKCLLPTSKTAQAAESGAGSSKGQSSQFTVMVTLESIKVFYQQEFESLTFINI